ncbi:FadR/GntR family transcriptional regulator [Leucobacter insecticola]|uniref:FadR/GntR family transcriptional regulator n=1 Tax=Leucobacter insecticola TaxID=2714934 RepID=UPI00313844A7
MATPEILETVPQAPKVLAADAVFQQLREAIVRGDYPEGSKLPSEAKLAAVFGVSRPVVREALQGCAALGLTETRVGSGTVVLSRHGNQGSRSVTTVHASCTRPARTSRCRRRPSPRVAAATRTSRSLLRS